MSDDGINQGHQARMQRQKEVVGCGALPELFDRLHLGRRIGNRDHQPGVW